MKDDDQFVSCLTLFKIQSRYPDILDFYKNSPEWTMSCNRDGYVAKSGAKGFFSSQEWREKNDTR